MDQDHSQDPKSKAKIIYMFSGKSLRNKKIDFTNLGQKKTLSNSSCHKCKNMIPVNEENICMGPLEQAPKTNGCKKRMEPCSRRFCNECLQKYYKDSWQNHLNNSEIWICPVCLGICNCSQCIRKKTKESQMKNDFLAQFDQPEKPTTQSQQIIKKRQEKELKKSVQKLSKPIIEIKKIGKYSSTQSKSQSISSTIPNSSHILKNAVTDDDWKAYLASKQRYIDCLKAHDWSHIPKVHQLQQQIVNKV